jgi:hypothetical protein
MGETLTAIVFPAQAGYFGQAEFNYCKDCGASSMPRSAAIAERLNNGRSLMVKYVCV